jgi:adenylate cyclase class IV
MAKNIELEIRGEIRAKEIPEIGKRLIKLGFRHASTTKRTSVMSFGSVRGERGGRLLGSEQVDVRCRITNGHAEIVAKIGRTSAANREEVAIPVTLNNLCAFSRMFGAMPFFTKVGSRSTWNYIKGSIVISLVRSPSYLAYIELEKMTDRDHEATDLVHLKTLAKQLGIQLWKSHDAFVRFCARLTKQDDWVFQGTDADVKRLMRDIKRTGSAIR